LYAIFSHNYKGGAPPSWNPAGLGINSVPGCPRAPQDNLVPPLEFVIETRWPGVAVDWNGTEPIL